MFKAFILKFCILERDKKGKCLNSFQSELANSANPDEMLQNEASDQSLHCLH